MFVNNPGSDVRAEGFRGAILILLLTAASGCSSSGGSITIFPHQHKLLDAAEGVALCTDKYGPLPRELQKMPLEAYYVQPGDVLLMEVVDLEASIRLPVDQTIMPDGTIDLAEFGRPVVAGMTVEQIEDVVRQLLLSAASPVDAPEVNVRLTVAESAVFYVLGEVNSPGAYPLLGRETVLDALMTAGGLSDRASECNMILSRPTPPGSCRVVLPICYRQIVQLGDTTTNYQIQPGDRIYITTRSLCEQLKFWHDECEMCPEGCTYPCPSSYMPSGPPFAVRETAIPPIDEHIQLPQFLEEQAASPAVDASPAVNGTGRVHLGPPAMLEHNTPSL